VIQNPCASVRTSVEVGSDSKVPVHLYEQMLKWEVIQNPYASVRTSVKVGSDSKSLCICKDKC
jgi:hypothetical protein